VNKLIKYSDGRMEIVTIDKFNKLVETGIEFEVLQSNYGG